MADGETLELIVRTPHDVVLQTTVHSMRLLTETGHVGLRPRIEATVLAIEAGIVNARPASAESSEELFIGTAGGLLTCDGHSVTLFTPLAVAGNNETDIVDELDRVMNQPNSEMEARTALSKLEGHILSELHREQKTRSGQKLGQLI